MATILCVDDEPAVAALIEQFLTDIGYQVRVATSAGAACRISCQIG